MPLLETREALLVRATDGRWRALLQRANVLSEGAPRSEGSSPGESRTWFGSTSILLPLAEVTDQERALLAKVAAFDVHLRARALRLAREEAALRAPAPLGTVTCAVRVQWESQGLRIDVDVEAPIMEARARASGARRGGSAPDGPASPRE
jgi:hypothetical protein